MSDPIVPPDRLTQAIGEFREELLGWIDDEIGRLRERPRDLTIERAPIATRGVLVETAPPSVAPTEPRTGAANPRERFDALARLLDDRLKQARGADESNGGDGVGRTERGNPQSSRPDCRE